MWMQALLQGNASFGCVPVGACVLSVHTNLQKNLSFQSETQKYDHKWNIAQIMNICFHLCRYIFISATSSFLESSIWNHSWCWWKFSEAMEAEKRSLRLMGNLPVGKLRSSKFLLWCSSARFSGCFLVQPAYQDKDGLLWLRISSIWYYHDSDSTVLCGGEQ